MIEFKGVKQSLLQVGVLIVAILLVGGAVLFIIRDNDTNETTSEETMVERVAEEEQVDVFIDEEAAAALDRGECSDAEIESINETINDPEITERSIALAYSKLHECYLQQENLEASRDAAQKAADTYRSAGLENAAANMEQTVEGLNLQIEFPDGRPLEGAEEDNFESAT